MAEAEAWRTEAWRTEAWRTEAWMVLEILCSGKATFIIQSIPSFYSSSEHCQIGTTAGKAGHGYKAQAGYLQRQSFRTASYLSPPSILLTNIKTNRFVNALHHSAFDRPNLRTGG